MYYSQVLEKRKMMDHCAAFIPLLHPTPHLALRWYFITVAKTPLLCDLSACGDAKPPSPISKHMWAHHLG